MAETPTTPKPPVKGGKGFFGKLKGLPPWAYVLAIGVGGGAIWFGIQRSKAQAEAEADYMSGDYNASGYQAGSAGDAYPIGSQGAGYYFDPTTGTTDLDRSAQYFDQFSSLLETLIPLMGGGTQPSASPSDHYTPPQITVNVPPPPAQPAAPPPPAPSPAPTPKPPDPCKGEYPFLQTSGPRAGMCYKVVLKNGKRYRYYANGDKVLAP